MKQKFTILLCIAFSIAAVCQAQINEHNYALGGNVNFYHSRTKFDSVPAGTVTSLSLTPSFVIFYKNNRAVGLGLTYEYEKDEHNNISGNGYGGSIFLRQYKPLGKGFYVFANEELSFVAHTTKHFVSFDNYTYYKYYMFRVAANPGIAYDCSKKFQLELLFFNDLLSAYYLHNKVTSGADKSTENIFSVTSNLDFSSVSSLNIGAKIFFGR